MRVVAVVVLLTIAGFGVMHVVSQEGTVESITTLEEFDPCPDSDSVFYQPGGVCVQAFESDPFSSFIAQAEWQQKCKNDGLRLISITDEKKQFFIEAGFETKYLESGNESYWIGLEFNEQKNAWIWQNGEPLGYSNFLEETDLKNPGPGKACVVMDGLNDMKWIAESCSIFELGGICERHLCDNNGGCQQVCSVKLNQPFCQCYTGWEKVNQTHCSPIDLCGTDMGGCGTDECRTVNGTKKLCLCEDGKECDPSTQQAKRFGMELKDLIIPGTVLGAAILLCGVLIVAYKARSSTGSDRAKNTREMGQDLKDDVEPPKSAPLPVIIPTPVYDPIMGSPV